MLLCLPHRSSQTHVLPCPPTTRAGFPGLSAVHTPGPGGRGPPACTHAPSASSGRPAGCSGWRTSAWAGGRARRGSGRLTSRRPQRPAQAPLQEGPPSPVPCLEGVAGPLKEVALHHHPARRIHVKLRLGLIVGEVLGVGAGPPCECPAPDPSPAALPQKPPGGRLSPRIPGRGSGLQPRTQALPPPRPTEQQALRGGRKLSPTASRPPHPASPFMLPAGPAPSHRAPFTRPGRH